MKEVTVIVTVYFNHDSAPSDAQRRAVDVVTTALQDDLKLVERHNVNSFHVTTPDGTQSVSVL